METEEMKKILLVGKLNAVVKETNKFLSQFFHVQLCSCRRFGGDAENCKP